MKFSFSIRIWDGHGMIVPDQSFVGYVLITQNAWQRATRQSLGFWGTAVSGFLVEFSVGGLQGRSRRRPSLATAAGSQRLRMQETQSTMLCSIMSPPLDSTSARGCAPSHHLHLVDLLFLLVLSLSSTKDTWSPLARFDNAGFWVVLGVKFCYSSCSGSGLESLKPG